MKLNYIDTQHGSVEQDENIIFLAKNIVSQHVEKNVHNAKMRK